MDSCRAYIVEGEINWSGQLVFSSSFIDGAMSKVEATFIRMLTMFVYKYVYRSCCLYGNNGVPLEFVCVAVLCEGRGLNPILNTIFRQMWGGLCPDYNSDSYVVQSNIKIKKKVVALKLPSAKTFLRQTVSAPKRLGAKTSWRQNVPAPKRSISRAY